MTTITIVITALEVVVLVDATAIKNCCNVAVGDRYFSINENSSGVYTIIDLCEQGTTVQGYGDTVTDGGGWLVVQRRRDGSKDSTDLFIAIYLNIQQPTTYLLVINTDSRNIILATANC